MTVNRNTYGVILYRNDVASKTTTAVFNEPTITVFADVAEHVKTLLMAAGYDREYESFVITDNDKPQFLKLDLVEN